MRRSVHGGWGSRSTGPLDQVTKALVLIPIDLPTGQTLMEDAQPVRSMPGNGWRVGSGRTTSLAHQGHDDPRQRAPEDDHGDDHQDPHPPVPAAVAVSVSHHGRGLLNSILLPPVSNNPAPPDRGERPRSRRAGAIASSRARSADRRERFGPTEEIPLDELDAQSTKRLRFGLGLHALGDQHGSGEGGEVAEPGGERLACRIPVDAPDDADVQLHDVGLQLEDVAEAGEAGTGVVDRDPHRSVPVSYTHLTLP